jgi:hypothetical protein
MRQAMLGDFAGAQATLATNPQFQAMLAQDKSATRFPSLILALLGRTPLAAVAEEQDDPAGVERITSEVGAQLRSIKPDGDLQVQQTSIAGYWIHELAARAAYRRSDFPTAEKEVREAITDRRIWGTDATGDLRDLGELSNWLALILARQGRVSEADAAILPVVKFQRQLATQNHGDQWLAFELARALYAQALAEPARARPLLAEAESLLATLVPQIAQLRDTKELHAWIRAAQHGPG